MFRRQAPPVWLTLLLLWPMLAWGDVKPVVDGVSGDLRDNVEAYIGEIRDEEFAQWTTLQLRLRRATRDAMEAVGYYDSRITVTQGGEREVRILVVPGEPVRIRRLTLKFGGEAATDEAFQSLKQRLPVREGAILHHGHYEAAKKQIQNLALERGYFDGDWERHEIHVDASAHSADIELHYSGGQRYRFGEVRFSVHDLSDPVLQSLVPFKRGMPYDAVLVTKFNKVLLDTRYFTDVRVRVEKDQAVAGEVPVRVDLTAGDPNTVDIGLGYATDVGPRISLKWLRPLFNERGHSIEVNTELSKVRRGIEAKYSIPWEHPIDNTIQLLYGVVREEIDDLVSYKTTLGVQHQENRVNGWQYAQYIRWDREFFRREGVEESTDLILPGVSWSRNRSRGGLDVYWGDRQYYQLEFTSPELASDADLIALRAGWRLIRSLGDDHRFLFRLDAGAIASDDFDKVPPSVRFYAGGDQSVRGYSYKSISPLDDAGNAIGGRYLLAGSAEYNYRLFQRWFVAAFVDHGAAVDSFSEPLKTGVGGGVRWLSPVGPIRLDLAWGVSDIKPSFRIHFSMGPSL